MKENPARSRSKIAAGLIHPGLPDLLHRLDWVPASDWVSGHRYALPGFFAAALSFISFLLVMTRLTETVRPQTGPLPPFRRAGIFSPNFWNTLLRHDDARGRHLPGLLGCVFLLSFGQSSLYGAFPLLCLSVHGASAQQVGLLYAFMGGLAVIVQGGCLRPLARVFREEKLFLSGCVMLAGGLASIPFAPSILYMMLSLGAMTLGASLAVPTLQSLVSQKAGTGDTGRLMGTSHAMSGLGRAVGPSWGGVLYGFGVSLPFLATAGILTLTFGMGIRLLRKRQAPET